MLEARAQRRTTCDDKIGIICYRRASVTLLTSELLLNDEDKSSFGIFRAFPCSPDCNIFGSACTDYSSFRCSPSAYLMQISWIFVCRASLRQVTASIDALRLLLFHAYFSVRQYVKELLLQSFPNLSRRKIVAARTTYFTRYVNLPLRLQRESTKRN